ncbi:Dabb family protein [Rhodococcus sp. ACPA1]|uniref:Dabb family protein n=1 Tax=Rhodococcus sp. ACPA1 TaxID=2028572 RepID=UPI000BB10DBC|nr:hypothetical protein CJ177_43450 [Rhodococcus sp. ACPA1]
MIAHIVNFTWKPATSATDLKQIGRAIDALPEQIPALRRLIHGPDLRMRNGNGDYGVMAVIEGSDPSAYLDHPAHVAVARDIVAPHVTAKLAVQFEMSDDMA